MAELNGVESRVQRLGQCEPSDLQSAIPPGEKVWVICDVEGYERVLLDPVTVPALAQASILVELHEFASAGIADELLRRFEKTHAIRRIWEIPRTRADYPFNGIYTAILPKAYATYRVQEFRPEKMSWFVMEPRTAG